MVLVLYTEYLCHCMVGTGSQPVTQIYYLSTMTDLNCTNYNCTNVLYNVSRILYVRTQQGTAHAIILIAVKNANKNLITIREQCASLKQIQFSD